MTLAPEHGSSQQSQEIVLEPPEQDFEIENPEDFEDDGPGEPMVHQDHYYDLMPEQESHSEVPTQEPEYSEVSPPEHLEIASDPEEVTTSSRSKDEAKVKLEVPDDMKVYLKVEPTDVALSELEK